MLDPRDTAILNELRRDSRQTLKELHRRTGARISTIHDKLRQWRRTGVILRYTARVNYAALGLHARAMVLFKLPKQNREAFGRELAECRNVDAFYRINNGWDFLAEIAAKDFLSMEALLDGWEGEYGLLEKDAHYLLEEGVKAQKPERNPRMLRGAR
jgi:DNA-binding Lrp family transcriptional regulator